MEYEHITHSFEPIYNEDSEILILGTLPSVKSRENNFYYGHKQNRFWKLLAKLCKEETPQTIEEKTSMLLRHHIAIWDVIQSCDIKGSSDSSIKNVTPTDLNQILNHCQIRQIYANGNKAGALYKKYQQPLTERDILVLPSTSPANAAYSLVAPITATGTGDFKLKITTQKDAESPLVNEVAVDLKGTSSSTITGDTQGKAFEITLTFKATEIQAKASVKEWEKAGTATGEIK